MQHADKPKPGGGDGGGGGGSVARSPACEALSTEQIAAAKDEAWRQHCAAAVRVPLCTPPGHIVMSTVDRISSDLIITSGDLSQGVGEDGADDGESDSPDADSEPAAAAAVEGPWRQSLFIEKVIATEEKHIFVCAAEPLKAAQGDEDSPPPPLQCGGCGAKFSSRSYPEACGRCRNKLVRWALS